MPAIDFITIVDDDIVDLVSDEEIVVQGDHIRTRSQVTSHDEQAMLVVPGEETQDVQGLQTVLVEAGEGTQEATISGNALKSTTMSLVTEKASVDAAAAQNCPPTAVPFPVNTTKTVEVESSKTHMNSAQHDPDEQSTSKRQMAANSEDHLNGCNTYNEHINHQSEAHDPDEEPYRKRKKQKTNATSAVIFLNKCKTTLGHLDHHIPSPSSCNVLVVERETISCRNSSMGQLPTTHDKPPNKGSSNCPQQGDPPRKSRRNEAAHPKGTRRTRSSHAVHGISSVEAVTTSTPAVRQTNLRGTCRKSSMGRAATQEKPLRKGKGLLHICSYNGCGKEFVRSKHLEDHVKSKHTESTGPFKCGLIGCTEVFPVKHGIEVHVKSHYEGEEIPCTSCGKKFSDIRNFNSHVKRMHTSRETPLPCLFKGCTKEFRVKHERKNHEKSVHFELDGRIKCHFKGCTSTSTFLSVWFVIIYVHFFS